LPVGVSGSSTPCPGSVDVDEAPLTEAALSVLHPDHRRKTVLFVTDDVEEVPYLADRIVVLTERPGRIKARFAATSRGRARWTRAFRRIFSPSSGRSGTPPAAERAAATGLRQMPGA
jgi:ABC-type Na+ transport system ATPase subunit NatA